MKERNLIEKLMEKKLKILAEGSGENLKESYAVQRGTALLEFVRNPEEAIRLWAEEAAIHPTMVDIKTDSETEARNFYDWVHNNIDTVHQILEEEGTLRAYNWEGFRDKIEESGMHNFNPVVIDGETFPDSLYPFSVG